MYCFHAMYSFQWNCQNKFSQLLFLVFQSSADIFHTKTIPQSQIWKEMRFPHHHFFGGTSQKTMISRWVIEMPRIFNIIRVGRSACLKTTHAEKKCKVQRLMHFLFMAKKHVFSHNHVFKHILVYTCFSKNIVLSWFNFKKLFVRQFMWKYQFIFLFVRGCCRINLEILLQHNGKTEFWLSRMWQCRICPRFRFRFVSKVMFKFCHFVGVFHFWTKPCSVFSAALCSKPL